MSRSTIARGRKSLRKLAWAVAAAAPMLLAAADASATVRTWVATNGNWNTAANWADPANVVADIAIGAQTPIPAVRARTPKETPKASTAMPIGTLRRAMMPSRIP